MSAFRRSQAPRQFLSMTACAKVFGRLNEGLSASAEQQASNCGLGIEIEESGCERQNMTHCRGSHRTILGRRIAASVICAALMMIMLGRWALYWLALSKIDGRPAHAFSSAFAAELPKCSGAS
jgi:hypothetical protein